MFFTFLIISIVIWMVGTGILFSYIETLIERRRRREALRKRLRWVRRYW